MVTLAILFVVSICLLAVAALIVMAAANSSVGGGPVEMLFGALVLGGAGAIGLVAAIVWSIVRAFS